MSMITIVLRCLRSDIYLYMILVYVCAYDVVTDTLCLYIYWVVVVYLGQLLVDGFCVA